MWLVTSVAMGEPSVPVRINFAGAPGCNDPRLLEREIGRRAETVVITADADAPTSIDVRVANGVRRVDSVLVIDRPGHARVTRAVTGVDCDEVIEATALIIVVLLTSSPEDEESAEPPPSPPPPPPPSPPSPPPPPPPPPPESRLTWRFGGGSAGALLLGVAPELLPGVEPFLELTTWRPGWSPAFRIGFRQAWRGDFATDETRVSFRLAAGTANACPVAWLPASRLAFRPCLVASVGSLEASAYRTERHPWLGVGGGIRLEAELLRFLAIDVQAASEVAGTQGRFHLDGTRFHETAPVVGWLEVGLAARFP
jgi:hypothetical protein